MKPMRVRIEIGDLESITPGSALHQRVAAQLAEETLDTNNQKYLRYAQENLHEDGDLEFDDDAAVSAGCDEGAYVMCWKWVYDHEAGVTKN